MKYEVLMTSAIEDYISFESAENLSREEIIAMAVNILNNSQSHKEKEIIDKQVVYYNMSSNVEFEAYVNGKPVFDKKNQKNKKEV